VSGRQACAPEYSTPFGEPCVPGRADLDCRDLAEWGISEARVIGEDVYGLDVDGDGTGCENNIPAKTTELGTAASDFAPIGMIVAVIVAVVVCVVPVQLAVHIYRQAEKGAEKRGMAFSAAMTVVGGLTLVLVGFFLFGLIGIQR